jgi:hypothetical protein
VTLTTLRAVQALMMRFQPERRSQSKNRPRGEDVDEQRRLLDAIAFMPNDFAWADWNNIGMAIWHATHASAAGYAAFLNWSAKSSKFDRAACDERWEHWGTSPPDGSIGAGTIFYHAKHGGWQDRHGPPPGSEGDFGTTASAAAPEGLCRPFILRPSRDIPARGWLYGGCLMRGFVSLLHGPAGVGKTSVYIVEGLALATGRDLLGVKPVERVPVWLLSLEEPFDEMERRIAAAAMRYGIKAEDLKDWLFVDGVPETPLIIARHGQRGVEIVQEKVAAIVECIERHNIGALKVDPLVACHAISENDNGEVNTMLSAWRGIAHRTQCAIELVHHDRKNSGNASASGTEQARGASALSGAVRIARQVQVLEKNEAAKMGVPEAQRFEYLQIDSGKNNLLIKGAARWVHITSMPLDNGDLVGTIEPWTPPDPMSGITEQQLEIVVEFLAANEPQRANTQSADWFGWKVAELFSVPGAAERNDIARSRANTILKVLERRGLIRRGTAERGRKDRPVWEAVEPEVRTSRTSAHLEN